MKCVYAIFFYIGCPNLKINGSSISNQGKNIIPTTTRVSRQKELLLEVVEGINRTFELKDLLKKCMEAARVVMSSEASSLMLLDEATGDLNVSIPTGPVKDEITGFVIPKDKGVGGWVLANNTAYVSNDVSESEIFWQDLSKGFKTRNIICVPLQDSDGKAFGVIQAINKKNFEDFDQDDIFVFETLAFHASSAIERARKYDEVVRKLADREMQISEIHHRLKNNLATICALIEFDLDDIMDKDSRQALVSTSSRVRSVAEAHSLLYDKTDSEIIDLPTYLLSVIHNVERVFEDPDKDIRINMHFGDVTIDANRAMLCGLIVNELLINVYKHAFVESNSGEVTVILKKSPKGKIIIMVTDDGIGFNSKKTDKSPENPGKPNGQFIVSALAKKLKADINYGNNPDIGSTCVFSFPV